jgi:hypothetical protein
MRPVSSNLTLSSRIPSRDAMTHKSTYHMNRAHLTTTYVCKIKGRTRYWLRTKIAAMLFRIGGKLISKTAVVEIEFSSE